MKDKTLYLDDYLSNKSPKYKSWRGNFNNLYESLREQREKFSNYYSSRLPHNLNLNIPEVFTFDQPVR